MLEEQLTIPETETFPQTVTIADTVYPGHCLYDDYHLFVYLNNISIIEGFPIFANPADLETIVENSYGITRTYSGYTTLVSISGEFGNCNAVLKKSAPAT